MLTRKALLEVFVLICFCCSLTLTIVKGTQKTFSHNLTPRNIHIAYGDTPESMVIMWSNWVDTNGSVEVTLQDDQTKSTEFPKTFSATSIILEQDNDLGLKFYHRAELTGLRSGGQYKYRVKSFTSTTITETEYFNISLPTVGGEHTFLVLADMGTQSKSLEFIRHEAMNRPYSAVFHIGDIAYNLNSQSGNIGDVYLGKISPYFTAYVAYMLTPGDHESFDGFYHYTHRFSMPQSSWPMNPEKLWYSIDIGFSHFISINTETFFRGQHQMGQLKPWLEKDLIKANENRERVPWIIVMGHKPIYCTVSVMEQECHKQFSTLRDQLDDVFYVHGVDLYISGHKHVYERTWPMYKGRAFQTDTVDPMATIHLIIGTMGYEYLTDDQGSHPFWLAFSHAERDKELFARLWVTNATHLTWQVIVAKNNAEIEKVHIIQRKHGSFGQPGEEAFKKINFEHQRENRFGENLLGLPPEPFIIVDAPLSTMAKYRRTVLYLSVLCLASFLFMFLRHPRFRRMWRVF